jgi:hypothetical protein
MSLQICDLFLQPFLKSLNTDSQVSSSIVLWVQRCMHIQIRYSFSDELPEMLGVKVSHAYYPYTKKYLNEPQGIERTSPHLL